MTRTTEHHETVIVGGGQAGLATAYRLTPGPRLRDPRRGRACRPRVAAASPSLRLYSPAHLNGLPGMPFPGPARACPTAGEMADQLEAYAERYALPIRLGVRVDWVERSGDGYVVVAGDDAIRADNVVVATGVIQEGCPPSRTLPPTRSAHHAAPSADTTIPASSRPVACWSSGRRTPAATSPTSSPTRGSRRRSPAGTPASSRSGSTGGSCGRWHRSCGSC